MRFTLRKKEPGSIEFALIYGGLAFLLLVAARLLPVMQFAPECVFRSITGLPCPTCGSTRSVVLLSHGHFCRAFAMNPAVTVAVLGAVFGFLYRIATLALELPEPAVRLSVPEKNFIRITAILVFLLNWIYLIKAL